MIVPTGEKSLQLVFDGLLIIFTWANNKQEKKERLKVNKNFFI